MDRVPVGASRRLRWGCLSLALAVVFLAVATNPADARKRKRTSSKQAAAAASYNPAYAAIVVDAKTGAVLHQSSPDGSRHPASLTKIMTLYLLFERLESGKISLDTPMPVSEEAASQAPTKLGLRPGGALLVEDAIKGLVTKSANDAAVVIAEALGGSEEEFARMMTRKAQAIGMRNTVYRNASGLPNDGQITTARDQALLGIAIQQRFPKFYRYFSLASFVYRGHAIRNHNKLLGNVEGVDGIKTGYTRASGFNLVTSVKRGYRHIVAVVLGGRSGASRDARMRELISGYIAQASAKPAAAVAQQTPSLPPIPTPVAKPEIPKPELPAPELAAFESAPATVPSPSPRPNEATAAIPSASDAPITPIKVKTLSVKLVPAKNSAPNDSGTAQPDPATTKSVRTAALNPPAAADVPMSAAAHSETTVAAITARGTSVPSRPSTTRGGWAIQVGAYDNESEAKEQITSAKGKIAPVFAKAEAYIERTVKGAKTYYRARFAGFDRDQAQAACKNLKRSEIDCLALKM